MMFGFMHIFSSAFVIAMLVGLVFLVVWAVKTLKKDELFKWSMLLIFISIVGWILLFLLSGYWSDGYFKKDGSGFRMGPGMMWDWSN